MCSSHIKEKYKIKEVFGANFGFKATSKTTTTTKSVHHISSTPIIELKFEFPSLFPLISLLKPKMLF